MIYKRFGDRIVCRLEVGEEITNNILELAEKEDIGAASISGIGAADWVSVGVFDAKRKEYDLVEEEGDFEITSLLGSITRKGDKAYQHIHMTYSGADGIVKGGHLLGATISLTCEIFIDIIDGEIGRVQDQAAGINVMSFE